MKQVVKKEWRYGPFTRTLRCAALRVAALRQLNASYVAWSKR